MKLSRVPIIGLVPSLALAILALAFPVQAYDYKVEKILSPAPVFSQNGIVSSAHPIASSVGVQILREGGNAFDAAVAVALTLNAVDMSMCGPGGASFWLLWEAKEGKLHSLDADTQAPAAATPDKFKDRSELLSGVKAMGIPGNMKAYVEVLEKFGTMSFEEVSKPAIKYLEEGFVLAKRQSDGFKYSAAQAPLQYPNLARVFAPDGHWPDEGAIIKNPELAQTFKTVAKEGVEAFYKGSIAKEMVDYVQKNGGLWTMEDLANYKLNWNEPVTMNYKGLTVYGAPPPSSATTWMEMLKIAEGYDWSKIEDNSLEYLHLMVEIVRVAQADTYQWVSDPAFVPSQSHKLVSEAYAKVQRQRISLDQAAKGKVQPGDPEAWSQPGFKLSQAPENLESIKMAMADSIRDMTYRGNTNHVVVTDKWGNCVTFTHTLGQFFGGQDLLGNTGVIGNNGMDWFDLDLNPWTEKKSNLVVAPNKRNRWTLSPGMIFKDGKPYILVGGSGAEMTMQAIFQVLIRMLEYKLNPQAAIASPRFLYGDVYHYTAGTRLHVEPELRAFLEKGMKQKGHDLVPGDQVWRMPTGFVWAIELDHQSGTFAGGAEVRDEGHAAAY
ncbi:MAG: gamma-glutamyltransferase [Deltaproteobacteria bacterium]|jgi:gamma-glutamyltranspeptidase/glutathione hydrolase|nr:gamma-glutamyltransferase [Deltaproteobacteria bacterium]